MPETTTRRCFLGIDCGAESGRAMLGTLEGPRLRLEEVHRFPNEPVRLHETLTWDLPRLLREVQRGIAAGAARAGGALDGIAVDSWGVDFGLLDRSGGVLQNPVHYRDGRTRGVMEEVFRSIPRERIFDETGIQFLSLNTLYQVAALRRRTPEVLEAAGKLLLMADLVAYLLCGRAAAELTLASTSQMWSPVRREWSRPIIEAIGAPRSIFPEVVGPGTALAPLRPEVAREAGLASPPPVIATAAHDTASAVAAVPASGPGAWGYLSSGTWSLLGVELPAPRIAPEVLARNFTNEGGVAGTTRFLKNLSGLWLVQECRRRWARDGEDLDYGALTVLAEQAGAARAFVLPGHPDFFAPADMPEAIRAFCRRTGQPVPAAKGEVVRCALESLALAYREAAEAAREVLGHGIDRLHLVGGGSQNRLLDQLAADALGVPVLAGPAEATALGNILVQAMAVGEIGSLEELRAVVRASVRIEEYAPRERAAWDDRYAQYRRLAGRA
ncbi:MAG: rhamnulokinase [Planctomycetes bacterium]|nr:rhamnulokinase [Planctomycetota bacterium]